jgi:hypothetical protein
MSSWFLLLQTRLSLHRSERALGHIVAEMATHGDSAGLGRVLELPVAAFCADQRPPGGFKTPNHFSNLHVTTLPHRRRILRPVQGGLIIPPAAAGRTRVLQDLPA